MYQYSGRGGGGAYVYNSGTVTINNNTFSGNYAQTKAGGAHIQNSEAITINNNTFSANTAQNDGAGMHVSDNGPVVIVNNTFSDNSCLWSGSGGGVCYSDSDGIVTMTNNTFSSNRSSPNYSDGGGGGAYIYSASATINNNTFGENYARAPESRGGGAYITSTTLTMNNNEFIGNSTPGDQGGGGAWIDSGNATLNGNTFRQNIASAAAGGGLCFANGSGNLLLANNVFSLNSSSYGGGGVFVFAGANTMVNNTITENSAPNGGGVYFTLSGVIETVYAYNNIIWGNTATVNGGDVFLAGTGSRKDFQYNNAHAMYGVWDIAQNNLDVAPMFFDPVNGNYRLRNTSVCINAGLNSATNLPATDADGELRIQNVTVDMGAYEFSNTGYHPADLNQDWIVSASEYNAYAAAWKNDQAWSVQPSPIPADYATRAGYISANGGNYYNDGGGGKPLSWKPGIGP